MRVQTKDNGDKLNSQMWEVRKSNCRLKKEFCEGSVSEKVKDAIMANGIRRFLYQMK